MKMLKDMSSEDDVCGNTGSYSCVGKPQTSINMFAFQLCVWNRLSVPDLNLSKYKTVYTCKSAFADTSTFLYTHYTYYILHIYIHIHIIYYIYLHILVSR